MQYQRKAISSDEARWLGRAIGASEDGSTVVDIINSEAYTNQEGYASLGWKGNPNVNTENIRGFEHPGVIVAYKDCGNLGYIIIYSDLHMAWADKDPSLYNWQPTDELWDN
ncbi:MAG: hypothetical protein ACQKBW_07150 [Puniceicoccales bacterium]